MLLKHISAAIRDPLTVVATIVLAIVVGGAASQWPIATGLVVAAFVLFVGPIFRTRR